MYCTCTVVKYVEYYLKNRNSAIKVESVMWVVARLILLLYYTVCNYYNCYNCYCYHL